MTALETVERDVLILACAISAGIHAALVHEHLTEGAATGGGFLAGAVALGALVVVLTLRPPTAPVLFVASAALAGLLAGYALAVTTGVPFLHPQVEPVEGLALATKAIETVGLVAALHLIHRRPPVVALTLVQTKGTPT